MMLMASWVIRYTASSTSGDTGGPLARDRKAGRDGAARDQPRQVLERRRRRVRAGAGLQDVEDAAELDHGVAAR
jgi:hypothetical protein